jgi:hypothetical protein
VKLALPDRPSRTQNAAWRRSLLRGGGLGLLVGLAVVTPLLPPSSLTVPPPRTLACSQESVLARHIFESYAARPLGNFTKSGPGADPVALLAALGRANPTTEALAHEFTFPHGQKLTYDLASKPDQWVMLTATGQKLDRNFDQWPLLDGHL